VNNCKLFRLLIKRDLLACIIRVLNNMYAGHLIRIYWVGVMSDYFNVLHSVKRGAVISPIVFCIYIDDLLVSVSQLGVGCYIAGNFVSVIVYADDIVLISQRRWVWDIFCFHVIHMQINMQINVILYLMQISQSS